MNFSAIMPLFQISFNYFHAGLAFFIFQMPGAFLKQVQSNRRFKSMSCENCGHQISATAKFCSACGHPVGTAPSPGAVAPPAVPAKRESPRLKASSGNGSITRMSGTRRKPWLLRMPIPDRFYSFPDFQKQFAVYSRKYNRFPIRPLGWLDPLCYKLATND